jgi:hypothetical protein
MRAISRSVLPVVFLLACHGPVTAQVDKPSAYDVARFAHDVERIASQLQARATAIDANCAMVSLADGLGKAAAKLKDSALEIQVMNPTIDTACATAWKAVLGKARLVATEYGNDPRYDADMMAKQANADLIAAVQALSSFPWPP